MDLLQIGNEGEGSEGESGEGAKGESGKGDGSDSEDGKSNGDEGAVAMAKVKKMEAEGEKIERIEVE